MTPEELVAANLPLVRHVLAQSRIRPEAVLDLDDAYQDGCIGLLTAARRYRTGGTASFAHFACKWIDGTILMERRRIHHRGAAATFHSHVESLDGAPARTLSEDDAVSLSDALPLDEPDLDERVLWHDLRRALRALPEVQRTVLVLYYWHDRTWKEIGAMMGFSRDTAINQGKRGIRALRAGLEGAR